MPRRNVTTHTLDTKQKFYVNGVTQSLTDTLYPDKAATEAAFDRTDPGSDGTNVTLPHVVRSSRWHAPTGDNVTDDRAALQALLDAGAGGDVYIDKPAVAYRIVGPLTVPAGTTVTLHPQCVIRQVTHYQPVFDVYDVDDVVIRGQGATLQYTGSRTYASQPSYRGSTGASYGAGVWCNGNRCRVEGLRLSGFRSGVFLSGYVTASGAQVAEAHSDNVVQDIVVDTVDFGVLASGQVNPVVRNVRGSYELESGSGDPAHLIYFSDAAASRNIDVDGLTADSGTGGTAFQFKGVYGGKATNLLANTCPGLLSLTKVEDATFAAVARNDTSADENGSLYMFGSGSDVVQRCTVDIAIHAADSTTGFRVARVDGTDNVVTLRTRTRQTSTTAVQAVTVQGTRNTLDLWLVNTDTGGTDMTTGRLAVGVLAGSRHTVRVHEARNVYRGVDVVSGVTNCLVAVDSSRARPIASGASNNFCSIAESTTTLTRDGTQLFSVSGGTQTRPDSTLYRTARLTLTDSTNFVLGGLYGTPPQGTRLTIIIDNQSGGAGPTITWSGITLASAWTNPASGATKAVELIRDGSTWKEIGRTA